MREYPQKHILEGGLLVAQASPTRRVILEIIYICISWHCYERLPSASVIFLKILFIYF